jgi:hypothetical protein
MYLQDIKYFESNPTPLLLSQNKRCVRYESNRTSKNINYLRLKCLLLKEINVNSKVLKYYDVSTNPIISSIVTISENIYY